MISNVLIPTDFSENSWNAIQYAISFLKNRKCVFYLLHVNEINNPQPFHKSNIPESRNQIQSLIHKIEEVSEIGSHKFFGITASGNIVDAIRTEMERKHIDLIVMGTKGVTGIKKIAVGSNTTDVISKVKCNTLVIPEGAKFTGISNVALPTDYNIFYGAKILETISDVIELLEAQIHIIHLAKKNELIVGDQFQNKELLQDYFMEDNHRFMSLTNRNLDKAIQECVEKHEIKLIAMIAKNIHFFQQIFFSSNTSNTRYQKEIPFLVLHE